MNTIFYRTKDDPKRYKRRRWSTIRFSASSSDNGIPQNMQLQTPACVRGSVPPSVVSNQVPHANEANSSPMPSPVTVAPDSPTSCVAGAIHRNVTPPSTVDYASSAWACSAIFVPDPTNVNALPTPSEVRAAKERDQALQRWITHYHTSTSRFKPGLIECEDNTNVWADVSVTPARVKAGTSTTKHVLVRVDKLQPSLEPKCTGGANASVCGWRTETTMCP